MQKILVIGSGGAGKSTFARELAQRLQLEVIHLDTYYYAMCNFLEPPSPQPLSQRGEGLRLGSAPLLPFWEQGLGDEGCL